MKMAKVTQAQRNAVRTILKNSNKWDASTMRINSIGRVDARKNPDKTLGDHDSPWFVVGYVDDMVTAKGQIREGY